MYHMAVPLAVSTHAPNMRGELHRFSLHHQAINLINQENELITLHRYNNGLSPMGWLLKRDDFDDVHYLIADGATLQQQDNGNLIIGDVCLIRHYRQLVLRYTNKSTLDPQIVSKLLKPITITTGLFGRLNDNITRSLPSDLKKIIQQFMLLLVQKPYDLTPYIGLGPGLTPSYDDMIVGILAVLHSEITFDTSFLSQSIDLPISQLELLTTKVSATFLDYAIHGIFTSSLLAVLSLIRQYKSHTLAIDKLVNYGHTSGADLLLGIWLGALVLEGFHLHKEGIIC